MLLDVSYTNELPHEESTICSMLAHHIFRGLESILAVNQLAFGIQKLNQLLGRHVLCGTGKETRTLTEFVDNVLQQCVLGVRLARRQHHLHHFVAMDLVHEVELL